MSQKAVLYAMCGLPFSGKSTLAHVLAEHLMLSIISLDSINHERGLGSNGKPISSQQWAETHDESYRRTRSKLEAGASLIYDATNFLRSERNQLRAIAAEQSCACVIIYATVDPTEARRRLISNRSKAGRHDIREEDFWLVLNAFEAPVDEAGVVLYDSTKPRAVWIAEELLPFVARQLTATASERSPKPTGIQNLPPGGR